MTEIFIALSVLLSISSITFAWLFVSSKRHANTLTEQLDQKTKSLEQKDQSIQDLTSQLQKKNRPRHGLVAKWLTPNEEESSYILNIYNDHPDRIFNITVTLPSEFKDCCRTSIPKTMLDSESELQIYMLPDRQPFATRWLKNKLETITLEVSYTETPINKNPRSIQVPFKVANTSEHFRSWLKITAKGKTS